MDVIELLEKKAGEIVDVATDAVMGAHLRHYESVHPEQTRQRLEALCDITLGCLKTKSAAPMIKYAEKIAGQRFTSGFSLSEVQRAFNVLEESIWSQILDQMKPDEYATAVALVSTALRIGKESVARIYFSLISRTNVPSLDIKAAFADAQDA